MKNFNLLTFLFALAGLVGLCGLAFNVHGENWPVVMIIALLVVLVGLFPVQLPSGTVYSSGVVGFIFLLFEYGYAVSALAMTVSTVVTFAKVLNWRIAKLVWHRFFATLGMYYVSGCVAFTAVRYTGFAPLFLRVFVALALFELTNALLLTGIRRSLGQSVSRSLLLKVRELAIPIFIFSVVVTRFLMMKDWRSLISEIVFALFFLFVIYLFSTQYRRVADAYRASEEKYRIIAENTLDMIVVLDETWRMTYASPSHPWVLGASAQGYQGKSIFEVVHPDDVHDLRSLLRSMRQDHLPFQAQFRYLHHADTWLIVEGHGSPVMGQDGDLERVVLVIRDITERQETEELLRKSDKLAVVGQLAAGVAHEVRNPLTALKGFLQLMRPKVSGHHEYVDIMLGELSRIELIIGEFLILAKPHVVQFQRKRPHALIESVIALLDTQAILNNVQIDTDVAVDIPPIECEENQIKQVFINVLKNAIEAMPRGGRVFIQALSERDTVVVRFKDQGPGIPDESLRRLGEPFYTTKDTGTGLGLMVSYRIIQAHNGEMEILSTVNEGTTVEIRLPAVS